MKLWEQLKNRHNILMFIIFTLFLIMIMKLSVITLRDGEKYRELANNKSLREVLIPASRGEIKDRYGRILATNKPSFTVKIVKDQVKKDKRNQTALRLLTILDEEGESYEVNFPIDLNVIKYKDINMYLEGNNINEELEKIIIENDLVKEFLLKDFVNVTEKNSYSYSILKKAVQILNEEKLEVPINFIQNKEKKYVPIFDGEKDIKLWKKKNQIPEEYDEYAIVEELVKKETGIIKKLLTHPVSRKSAYETLKKHNLTENYELMKYGYTYDLDKIKIKSGLINSGFEGISYESEAKDDFVNIVMDSVMDQLLLSKITVNKKEVPAGKVILDLIEAKGKENILNVNLDEEKNVFYEYKYSPEELKQKDIDVENIKPEEYIRQLAFEEGVIKDFITDDKIKGTAQQLLLEANINPKISVKTLKYTPTRDKDDWLEGYKLEEASAEEAFKKITEKYNIDESLSDYEKRFIMIIQNELRKALYKAYQPITLAYSVKDVTAAKLMEQNMDIVGVRVEIEPIREYPMKESAAHILGYLGKISQPHEIQKYIKEKKYSPNDIIGKIGVEAWFEDELRGQNGKKTIEADVFGNTISTISKNEAIKGNDLYLSIDLKLQKLAEDSLKHALEELQKGGSYKSKWGDYSYKGKNIYKNATSGSMVAIDVKTGEVLALANYPAYDPNLFSTGISVEDFEKLKDVDEKDPLSPRPLYNIALQTAVQPGSIFKMIPALSALQKGMSPRENITDYGYVEIGNQRFGCWIWNSRRGTHGNENMYDAIRDSCNYYFYSLVLGENKRSGKKTGVKISYDDITDMARQFGMGEKSGIEITGERRGNIPSSETKNKSAKNRLSRFINKYIDEYLLEKASEERKEEIKNEILSWLDYDKPLTRGQTMKKLKEMGLEAEKNVGGRVNLTDIIKYDYLNQVSVKEADALNISIGQGQNAYTPVLMANYVATLANNGYLNQVSVINQIKTPDGEQKEYTERDEVKRIQVDKSSYFDIIKKGMHMAAVDGTARKLFREFPVGVGVKTGTAEKDGKNPSTGENYDNFAWFVAFAPYEDPQIAVATLIFQGGSGGNAGPPTREVIAEYLGLNKEYNHMNFVNQLVQ